MLAEGATLGPYKILAPLGAGGMGEVYRAHDSRLGRDVAIKVLSPHLAASPEVRARFEREARTISQLNHPHICTLHDVGHQEGTDYLVMELLEGQTLAHRLEKGPVPVAEVLALGAQIADALDRAHRAGVVHRDLKPGNVMLTKGGAKLMDFGLARAAGLAAAPGALTESPTVSRPLTAEGAIVGTFQYMAPEQLEGKEADARTDLWALGCVLYEMVTGKRAFEGKSQASLIAAILERDPAPIALPSTRSEDTDRDLAPASGPLQAVSSAALLALDRVVRQCLAKDPDERWQSAGDLRRELEWLRGDSSAVGSPVGATRRPRRRPGWPAVALGAAVGLALGTLVAAYGPWRAAPAADRLVRFSLAPPAGTFFGYPAEAALSPDGMLLAFIAMDSSGTSHVFVRPLRAVEPRVVPGTDGASLPFWSPDGRMLGFFANGKLLKVALDGTPPVTLCDAPDPRGGAWSHGDVILFAPNSAGPIVRVSASGGQPVALTRLDEGRRELGHRYPQCLPDGRHLLYVAIRRGADPATVIATVEGGRPVEVCTASTGARFATPAYLLYVEKDATAARQRLLVRHFDVGAQRATGDPELLLDQVFALNWGYPNLAVDDHDALVVQRWGGEVHFHFDWRDRSGAVVGVALDDLVMSPTFALSSDGRQIAYGGLAPMDLYTRDLVTGVSRRLTFQNKALGDVRWSHDGARIAYSQQAGSVGYEIRVKAADGSGADSMVFRGPGLFAEPESWSHDGRWLIARCSDSTGAFDLWKIPMVGQGAPHAYQHTPASETGASLSPDGRWLAYTVSEGGEGALYVQSFPEPGAKYQVPVEDVVACGWYQGGDELLALNSKNQVFAVPVAISRGVQLGPARLLFGIPPPSFLAGVAPDGQRFLTGTFDPRAGGSSLEVVLGWRRLLEKQ
jgi:Tol biopolymer transport system component